ITSNPGVGVVEAGWHCGAQPGGDGCCSGPSECGDYCAKPNPGCDAGCSIDKDKPLPGDQQTPGNCQLATCGGSKDDNGDAPEDEEGDCKKSVCNNGSPDLENASDPPDDCHKCEEGNAVPKEDGGSCEDGCGSCVDGNCEITDPSKPKQTQTAGDCKTDLCDGSCLPDPSDAPNDTCKTCLGCNVVDVPPPEQPGGCYEYNSNICQWEPKTPPACNSACQILDEDSCECVPNPDVPEGTSYGLCTECGPNGQPVAKTSGQCIPSLCMIGDCSESGCVNARPAPAGTNVSLCKVCDGNGGVVDRDPLPSFCEDDPCEGFNEPCKQCTVVNGSAVITNVDGPVPGNSCALCSGGSIVNNPSGSCSDGNQCTVNDRCVNAACQGGDFDPSVPGCEEESSEVTVRLTMFIPIDHVVADMVLSPDQVFTGDNRTFTGNGATYYDQLGEREPRPGADPDNPTYRIAQEFVYRSDTRQLVTAKKKNLSGTTQLFDVETSMTGSESCYRKNCPECENMVFVLPLLGLQIIPSHIEGECISQAARGDSLAGGIGNDEFRMIDAEPADVSSMSISLVESDERMAKFRMAGNPANAVVPLPLVDGYLPNGAVPSITWDFFLTIGFDGQGRPTSWHIQGAGVLDEAIDPFPGYELEINKQVIYQRDPLSEGNTPLGLSALPGFRVSIDEGGNL
ncbi:MAG TPA: hypothetical protein VF268_10580, partial [Gammaproteobacteria bacterium]